jgi:hypothetical protein
MLWKHLVFVSVIVLVLLSRVERVHIYGKVALSAVLRGLAKSKELDPVVAPDDFGGSWSLEPSPTNNKLSNNGHGNKVLW